MSMNTSVNTNPVNTIKPTTQIGSNTGRPSGVDNAAQFQPETQVDIQNSLKSVLTSLEKAAAKTDIQLESLPPEVQKMMNSLLKNAFSLESSIGKGLSDVLQNQKLTLEQLGSLVKLLEQAAVLNNSGSAANNLSDGLKTLLQNMNLVDNDGKIFDNISLNKLALQLLEGKNSVDLAQLLQVLIAQQPGNIMPNTPGQGDGLQFLKQLVQYFMPTSNEETASPPGNQPGQNTTNQPGQSTTNQPGQSTTNQPGQGTTNQGQLNNTGQPGATTNNQPANQPPSQSVNQAPAGSNLAPPSNPANPGSSPAATLPQNTPSNAQQSNGTANGMPNQALSQQPASNAQTAANPNANQTAGKPGGGPSLQPNANPNQTSNVGGGNNQAAAEQGRSAGQPQNANSQQAANIAGKPNAANTTAAQQFGGRQPVSNDKAIFNQPNQSTSQARNAANTLTRPVLSPLQNNSATLQVLKNLASQLLANPDNIPEAELTSLKNFVNDDQPLLQEKDVQELQKLVHIVTENIPQTVQLAGVKQNMPDLPKLWAFVQLCNLTKLLEISTERLRNAGKNINDFAVILKKAMQNENEVAGNQRSMSFMTPLYMGDPEKYYPTYVHIYDETTKNPQTDEEQKETWLRLCMLTENIGAVELVFRLYEKNNINLRLAFSGVETAESFTGYIPELKEAFANLPLTLNDIKVSAIGEGNG